MTEFWIFFMTDHAVIQNWYITFITMNIVFPVFFFFFYTSLANIKVELLSQKKIFIYFLML